MMALFQNLDTRRAVLTGMIGVGGPYETTTLKTFKEPFSPGLNDVLADLDAIVSDYGGFAIGGPVTWGTIFDNAAGQAVVVGDLFQWNCTDSVTPQDVYGCYYIAGGVLRGVDVFDTPLPMRQNHDAVPYVPTLAYPS